MSRRGRRSRRQVATHRHARPARRKRRAWKALLVVAAAATAVVAAPARLDDTAPRFSEVRHVMGTLSAPVPGDDAHRIERQHLVASRSAIRQIPAAVPSVPNRASGRLELVPLPRVKRTGGRIVTYTLEIERGLPIAAGDTARTVAGILADRRGWRTARGVQFVPVTARAARGGAKVDVRITLASPALADRLCAPLETERELSCWQRGRAVLNARRWMTGAKTYALDVEAYRIYLINHEVGHGIGRHHVGCPGAGRRAPVMVQQSKTLDGCTPWPWPTGAAT